jgi:subtilisin-like proprotein convertase family protein
VATTGSLAFTNTFTRTVGTPGLAVNTNTLASADVPKTVANLTTIYSTNTVALTGTNYITDVNVSVRMDETRDGDLIIALQHPDGTEVILANNRGGNGSNFGTGTCGAGEVRTVFDDEAATLISAGSAPFAGSFRPDGVLSNFDGKTLNGAWRLRVADTLSPNSSGTLLCWSLQVISSQQVQNCTVYNNAPVANNQSVTVPTNTAVNLTLTGSDVDGDPLSFRTNSLPVHGTLSNFSTLTGAITYRAVAGFSGTDNFTFLVNDGLANSAPATVSLTVVGGLVDSVGDGIPDAWRQQYFGGTGTTTNSQSCAQCDPDGDGFTNLQEYLAGTNPLDPSSALRIISIVMSGSNCLISFTTSAGKLYLLERTDVLVNPTWTTITNNVSGTGGIVQVSDPAGPAQPNRSYRVRLLP